MGRTRFIVIGALAGLSWAAGLRGYMMELAGPDSTFTFRERRSEADATTTG